MRTLLFLSAILALSAVSFSIALPPGGIASCSVITSPGSYFLVTDIVGSPNNASPFALNACMRINASNVDFDCAGYSITNDQNGSQYGVMVYGYDNVTVRNCEIYNYTYGIRTASSVSDHLLGNSIYGSNYTGIDVAGNDIVIDGNYVQGANMQGIRVSGYSNNLTGNTVTAANTGFYLQESEGGYLSGNNASGNSNDGFFLTNASSDNVLLDNVAQGNGGDGFELNLENGNSLSGNTASGNYVGFRLSDSDGNLLSGNDALDNSFAGFYLGSSDFNNLTGNTATGNDYGYFLDFADSNILSGNNGSSNDGIGFIVTTGDSDNVLEDNVAMDNGYVGFEIAYEDGNLLKGNLASGNGFQSEGGGAGFELWYAYSNVLEDNVAHDNAYYGFTQYGSSYNVYTNNTAYGNGEDGFYLEGGEAAASSNNLTNNLAYENGDNGFQLSYEDQNILSGNLARDNSNNGFYLGSSWGNTLINNTATGHDSGETSGIVLQGYYYYSENTLANNTLCNNAAGIFISGDDDNVLEGNTFCNNSYYGVIMSQSSGNSFTNDHLYNNGVDFSVGYDGIGTLSISGMVFDNPTGSFAAFTNLSLDDTLDNEGYALDHASSPGLTPAGQESFRNKYLNISAPSGAASIDSLTWHWTDAESSGYTESSFDVWKHNGTWTDLNATLDTGADTLSLTNVSNFSIFAILMAPPPSDGDGGDGGTTEDPLSVSVSSSIGGNVATVTSDGTPIEGANVLVDGLSVGLTNSSGQVEFPGCSDTVTVKAKKSGYQDAETSATLVTCPACLTDEDCPTTQKCSESQCVPVECGPCEAAENHSCKSLCAAGEQCVENQCKAPEEGCSSDLQCDPDQFCDILPGHNTGACKDLCADGSSFCQCSNAVDHALVPTGWECGDQALGCQGCPAGEQCVDHKCVAPDLSCPATGIVGDQKTCDGTDCPDCDYEVTLPDGTKATGKTDADGDFGLPLNLEGTYRITLLRNGTPLKTVEIKALPQSKPGEEEKPPSTATGDLNWLWLILLLIVVVLGFLYWRSRGKK